MQNRFPLGSSYARNRAYSAAPCGKSALQMRVAEKCERQFKVTKASTGFPGCSYVFVFVSRGAVTNVEVLQFQGAPLEVAKIIQLLAAKFSDCPAGSSLRDVIEPFEILDTSDYFVVIASNDRCAIRPGPFQDSRWMRIVSDQVATADNLFKTPFCIRQHCA